MRDAFQSFYQIFNIVVTQAGRKPQIAGSSDEGLPRSLLGSHESDAQKMVECLFEGLAGAAHLLVQEIGNIGIQREGRSHIMMITK